MSTTSEPTESPPIALAECPLTHAQQTRNLLIFGANASLYYLAAPVFYVGILHAVLCKKLEASDFTANLPNSMYLWSQLVRPSVVHEQPSCGATERHCHSMRP